MRELTDALEAAVYVQNTNAVRPFFIVIGVIAEFDSAADAVAPGTPAAPVDLIGPLQADVAPELA